MVNKRLVNVEAPTSQKDGVNKSYVDTNFLKLSVGTVTGHIILSNPLILSQSPYVTICHNILWHVLGCIHSPLFRDTFCPYLVHFRSV